MSITFRWMAGVVVLSASVAFAAEPAPPGSPPARDPYPPAAGQADRTVREVAPVARAGNLDSFMTDCLRKGNMAEITLAKLAQKKTASAEVKDFADTLIKDHGEFLAKLEGGGAAAPGVRTTTTPDANAAPAPARPAAPPARTDAAARTDIAGGPMEQLKQMGNEIFEQCLTSAQRELEQKDGIEFDKCFVGMQVGAHMKMVNELTVFKRHASPQLVEIVTEGLQKSQEHLEHAKKLAKHLDTLPAASTARQSEEIRK